MKVEIARIPSSSIAPNEASMIDIPNNVDGLTAIVVRSSKKLSAWINSCPHDGRQLCNDPKYLWNKELNRVQCMHHQAVFEPDTGLCDNGPCRGETLTSLPVEEKNGEILIFMNYL